VSDPAVRTSALVKSFGRIRALDGVDLEADRGRIFGIVGPDGAGKTTLVRILAAVLSPDSGEASVLGLDPVRDRSAVHDRIGYVSQRFGLYHDLTVEENIRFYADLYGVSRRRLGEEMERLLAWSGLGPFRRRSAGALSGGMKQKLGLACALVHTPELMLLDEPTNGVDPVARREFWQLLERLVEGGLSVIVTTSYLEEAGRCHRLAFLSRGRVTAAGTPEQVTRMVPGEVLRFPSPNPFEECDEVAARTGAVATVSGSRVHVMGGIPTDGIEAALGRPVEASLSPASLEDAFVYLAEKGDA